ncbi:MAG: ATP-binding protein [Candidatus Eisenbacteria bacterium]
MAESRGGSPKNSNLRGRAEQKMKEGTAQSAGGSRVTEHELIHELEVHQLELEMQNEELRRAQLELEISRAKYFSLFDLAPVGYFTISEKEIILEANLTGAALLGVARRDLINVRFTAWVSEDSHQCVHAHWKRVLESRTAEACEVKLRRADGTVFHAQLTSEVGRDPDGHSTQCRTAVVDITDRRHMEAALRESEKLAAAGRMAVRIAHEINNPLAGIKNSFLLVKDIVDEEHPHYAYVGMIQNEIDRIADIVRKMFDLYGPDSRKIEKVSIDRAIREVVAMQCGNARVHGVEIELECPRFPVNAMLPAGHLKQVLLNVINNAVEASEAGGVITVTLVADQSAIIRVRDEGGGIQAGIGDRIFEPFFTTKQSGTMSGLGLGLSISRSMVEGMGGTIGYEIVPSGGTVFTITLPLKGRSGEVRSS